ncbi:hypothetical protein [Xanthobacter versatilis]|uniref:hypothetical protein n=1 Tax=Xanthobacter autotrophicus (strain ATCC BAA-1158 / Py2) TaxID=78245 RepID=UPI0037298E82
MTDNEPKSLPAKTELTAEQRRNKYNRAVREARLVTIDLRGVKFSADPAAPLARGDKTRRGFGSEIVEFQYDPDEKIVFSCIRWKINLKDGRKNIVSCQVDYSVLYDGFSSTEEEIVKLFVEYVARPATYAYFRALYAQLDWSAGLNSPPLPVVQFTPKV